MTEEQMLEMMMADLQKLNPPTLEKTYYSQLIQVAIKELTRKGITLDTTNDISHAQLVVMYACWLYRKRIDGSGTPRMLQIKINETLLSQKAQ